MESLYPLLLSNGAVLVFAVILATRLGMPLPATPILVVAGALGVHGVSGAVAIVSASAAANLLGDSLWFAGGRKWGHRVMKLLCAISLSPAACVSRSEDLVLRWGGMSLIAAKFIPGVSVFAPAMAGALRMSARAFVTFSAFSGVIWSAVLVGTGYVLRAHIAHALDALSHLTLAAVAVAIVGLAVLYLRRLLSRTTDAVARVTPADLRAALGNPRAPLIIDVRSRSAAAIDARFVPGALHVPFRELTSRMDEIAASAVVVYCNCPDDVSAIAAARILGAARGLEVRVLSGGLDGWFAPEAVLPAYVEETAS